MKAILKEDMIVQVTMDRGVEIGNIPRGVALDRLRWTGSNIIDLTALSTLHVRVLTGGGYELHAVPVPNSYPISMRYKDRKRLRHDKQTGTPYLAPLEEIKAEIVAEKLNAAEVKLCHNLGGNKKTIQSLLAFVSAIIVYESTGSAALKTFFDEITPYIKDAYPTERYQEILMEAAKNLKDCLTNYHTECDEINNEE